MSCIMTKKKKLLPPLFYLGLFHKLYTENKYAVVTSIHDIAASLTPGFGSFNICKI